MKVFRQPDVSNKNKKQVMKQKILIIGLLLLLKLPVSGHTGHADTIVCPVCGDSVVFYLTMSMTTFGGYLDFQKKGAIGYYYEEMINACPNCYYSGFYNDFDTIFTQVWKDSIKMVTSKYKGKELDNTLECEIAAEIKLLSSHKNDNIAWIYLIGTYFLRTDNNQIERRITIQRKTIEYLLKGIDAEEYDKEELATVDYLIAEMYRRIGEFEKAIEYYDLAIQNKKIKDWVKDFAKQQKKLAEKGDDNNNI